MYSLSVTYSNSREEPMVRHKSIVDAMADLWYILFKRTVKAHDLKLYADLQNKLKTDGEIAVRYGDKHVIVRNDHAQK